MNSNKPTVLVLCGTVVLLAVIGGAIYLTNTANPDAAMGLLAVITASVLGTVFTVAQASGLKADVNVVRHQTNGGLKSAVNSAVADAMEQTVPAATAKAVSEQLQRHGIIPADPDDQTGEHRRV